MSKLVYLDSNDFSDLSAPPTKIRLEDAAVLELLREAQRTGTARFMLSPPLLSEGVHITAANKGDALRRATLMRELCGTNALRYPTDICKIELTRALASDGPVHLDPSDILSGENEFFGAPFGPSTLQQAKSNALKQIDERLKAYPRGQRRKLKSQLDLTKASSRPLYRQMFKDSGWKATDQEFPLNLIDQQLLQDWFVGERNDADLDRHLRQIVSDPYVIFGYVADDTGDRETLKSIVRQGAGLSTALEKMGNYVIQLYHLSGKLDLSLTSRDLVKEIFARSMLRDLVMPLFGQPVTSVSDDELIKLVQRCPSVATLVHALHEYLHTIIQSNLARAANGDEAPTKVKTSDFGDFVHLMYAPYVDIFRCDARFGAHLAGCRHVSGRIAARRKDLPKMLGL